MRPALLVIDVQKRFFGLDAITSESLTRAIGGINEAIALFRAKQLPVICIQNVDESSGLVPGGEGFDLPDELAVFPSDPHIHKHYMNSFNKTPLEQTLRDVGVDTVVITGFCAEYCVLSTCRGAEDCDLTAIILRGAVASGVPASIGFVESINDMISFAALKKVLA